MEVFKNLFNDLVGILSLGTIAFVILIAIFFIVMFVRKSAHEE
ncbi:MAG: DUF3149 domain-containing protein [Gammaproteobacteria bacterium]|nr:DUF3149 domain-containing protein [Gammaproteobacteria bacterium]